MKELEEAGDMFRAYQVERGNQGTAQTDLGCDEQPGDNQALEDYEVIL